MAHFEGKRYGCSCPDGTCDMNCRMYRIAAGKPSNADRIRGMSDEELAKWLSCPGRKKDMFPNLEPYISPSRDEWLDWLKQEATE